ncbi:hypothetical protein BDBG_17040 [Blastomyces gilchristii SLH14081]|uniref:Uncharacterized protein n=1 Tax=Blastomyces gilchristii (strain SLH14081) TaxID=559298 RepID=A0A179UKD8_BLAGS|nr:uncharacterized protein BDBG_17040 [Blastomyces gilchristii SLH14081]OAT08434.1 hypothetical protein BDBG_17040 [Blastomyces gilchristii SLH14081]
MRCSQVEELGRGGLNKEQKRKQTDRQTDKEEGVKNRRKRKRIDYQITDTILICTGVTGCDALIYRAYSMSSPQPCQNLHDMTCRERRRITGSTGLKEKRVVGIC